VYEGNNRKLAVAGVRSQVAKTNGTEGRTNQRGGEPQVARSGETPNAQRKRQALKRKRAKGGEARV